MKNRNHGRFYAHLAFSEWDGYEAGEANQDFLLKVTDDKSNCDVFVFEPTLPGETWSILVLKYGGGVQKPELRPALKAQVDMLSNQLGATVEEAFGD